MKIILHIGTEKTGSTSIQSFLYNNASRLKDQGVYYFKSLGDYNNRELVSYCLDNPGEDDHYKKLYVNSRGKIESRRITMIEKFEEELNGIPRNTNAIIISSEHFSSRIKTESEILKLSSFFDEYFPSSSIEVVCFVREQYSLSCSSYSESIKFGSTKYFEEYVADNVKLGNTYFDYRALYDYWSEHFSLTFISYKNGIDVIAELLSLVDIKCTLKKSISKNTSIDYYGLMVLRSINERVNFYNKYGLPSLKYYLIKRYVISNFKSKYFLHNESTVNYVRDVFEQSNMSLGLSYEPSKPYKHEENLKITYQHSELVTISSDILYNFEKGKGKHYLPRLICVFYDEFASRVLAKFPKVFSIILTKTRKVIY